MAIELRAPTPSDAPVIGQIIYRAFEGIAEELRRQYNIGYVPDTEGKAGERRAIKVRVDRPNLVIRARDSYIVGSAKVQR